MLNIMKEDDALIPHLTSQVSFVKLLTNLGGIRDKNETIWATRVAKEFTRFYCYKYYLFTLWVTHSGAAVFSGLVGRQKKSILRMQTLDIVVPIFLLRHFETHHTGNIAH